MCGVIARSGEEWRATEQGQALLPLPPVEVVKIGRWRAEPAPRTARVRWPGPGARPDPRPGRPGQRADAGRARRRGAARRLPAAAERAAVRAGDQPRQALDLPGPGPSASDADRLLGLLADADVFIQGFRAGALERRGFGVEELPRRHPGLIYVSVNCYGPVGPWQGRPGWEQLGQTATGLAVGQGGPERPTLHAGPGLRLRHRLLRGARGDDRARPAGARGRQLPRPRLALSDRDVAGAPRAALRPGRRRSAWATHPTSTATTTRRSAG